MIKLKNILRESLLRDFCNDLESTLNEAAVSPPARMKGFLKEADEFVFKPFSVDPNEQKYFIAGSARLYLYPELIKSLKLKPIGDLDIVVPDNKHWDDLENYVEKFPNKNVGPDEIELRRYTPTPNESVEVFDKWLPKYDEEAAGDFEVRGTNTILKDSRNLGGYYYMSFYDIIDYKLALNREKEKPIVDLLIQYRKADKQQREVIKTNLMKLLGNDNKEAQQFLQPAL